MWMVRRIVKAKHFSDYKSIKLILARIRVYLKKHHPLNIYTQTTTSDTLNLINFCYLTFRPRHFRFYVKLVKIIKYPVTWVGCLVHSFREPWLIVSCNNCETDVTSSPSSSQPPFPLSFHFSSLPIHVILPFSPCYPEVFSPTSFPWSSCDRSAIWRRVSPFSSLTFLH